jgi:excisionase family DNA binding protein
VNESAAPIAGATEPAYLTPRQVAALLQISSKTLYRLASTDPTLPCLRIGGKGGALRFPKARLEAWLRAREQGLARPRRLTVAAEPRDVGAGGRA